MGIKSRLIIMNFLQFAIWGSYLVCIGNFLGRVGLGEYISWFYVAQGVVSIFMPAIIGAIADKFIEPQRLLGISHLTAAVFMLVAAWFGFQATELTLAGEATSIGPIFAAYCLSVAFYMPTIALSNTVAFSILKTADSIPSGTSRRSVSSAPSALSPPCGSSTSSVSAVRAFRPNSATECSCSNSSPWPRSSPTCS